MDERKIEFNEKDFTEEKLENIKIKKFDLIVTKEERSKIFAEIGYYVDKKGLLINAKTKKPKLAKDGRPINLNQDDDYALIAGSHILVRNVADYAHYLIENGLLPKLRAEEK